MSQITLKMPLESEGAHPLKIVLEPLCDCFTVEPGQKIEIHAVMKGKPRDESFTLSVSDLSLTVYPPCSINEFVECFATSHNVRLEPDGE